MFVAIFIFLGALGFLASFVTTNRKKRIGFLVAGMIFWVLSVVFGWLQYQYEKKQPQRHFIGEYQQNVEQHSFAWLNFDGVETEPMNNA
ncbi:MAG: hypothetical protein WCT08_02630 [Patescibacteria group bacterium]|jgi:hypothetical protein